MIHQEGGCPIEPTDLPADNRHLDFYQAALTLTDKTWQCWALGEYRVEDAINMAGIAYGLSRAEMKATPVTLTIINSNSPLRLDVPMCEALLAMGRAGQPVAMTPFTLSGAMSPVTLAVRFVQHQRVAGDAALSQSPHPSRREMAASPHVDTCARARRPRHPETQAALAGGHCAALGVPTAPATCGVPMRR